MKKVIILFALAILLTGCELETQKDEEKKEKESIVTTNQFEGDKGWKETYIEQLKTYDCVGDEYGLTCLYNLVDIDDNGTPELLVKTGIEEDEIKYDVFSYTNKLVNLGELTGVNSLLYDEDKYLIRQETNQGYEKIYHVTIEDEKLEEELIEENDYSDNLDEPYKNLGGALVANQIDDYDAISRY